MGRSKGSNNTKEAEYMWNPKELEAAGLADIATIYKLPTVKQRECLKCEQMFKSAGNFNRICDPCGRENIIGSSGRLYKEGDYPISKGKMLKFLH